MTSYEPINATKTSIEEDPEALRRISILKFFGGIGILFTLPFGVLSLFQDNYLLSLFLLGLSVLLIINHYLISQKEYYIFGANVIVYLFLLLFLYLVYSGGIENTGSLWIYVFPAVALFLHGLKYGLIDIALFMLLLSLMFYVNNGSFLEAAYTDAYKLRLILSFSVVTLLTALYEYLSIQSFSKMRLLTQRLIDVAKEEHLSDLVSKRGIYEEMELLFHYAKENNETLVVMLCDIDYLHDIHGRYGNTVGEMVIREISQEIQNSIKNSNTVARWSGEEFIILFPQMELSDVYKYATALEKRIKNLKIIHDRKPIQVSLTTGASNIDNVKSVYSAIRQADNKMYKA